MEMPPPPPPPAPSPPPPSAPVEETPAAESAGEIAAEEEEDLSPSLIILFLPLQAFLRLRSLNQTRLSGSKATKKRRKRRAGSNTSSSRGRLSPPHNTVSLSLEAYLRHWGIKWVCMVGSKDLR
ncbi:hypothetical protein AC579_1288 [Pseudocercospora musae]|uniref:Uncharacterized protein n=1 Tax=Pseudocercospora musae TaxID=113226 RepID=A0A139GT79_9PEZI|nr:hypothetical protein AC579_1288 [Pseudocercospora musae]